MTAVESFMPFVANSNNAAYPKMSSKFNFKVVPVDASFTRGRWKCWDHADVVSGVVAPHHTTAALNTTMADLMNQQQTNGGSVDTVASDITMVSPPPPVTTSITTIQQLDAGADSGGGTQDDHQSVARTNSDSSQTKTSTDSGVGGAFLAQNQNSTLLSPPKSSSVCNHASHNNHRAPQVVLHSPSTHNHHTGHYNILDNDGLARQLDVVLPHVQDTSRSPSPPLDSSCGDHHHRHHDLGSQLQEPTSPLTTQSTGSGNIDNKIEQAMDLVKTHLMYAVREEIEGLQAKIEMLEHKLATVEAENRALREYANPEILQQLPPPPCSPTSSSCVDVN